MPKDSVIAVTEAAPGDHRRQRHQERRDAQHDDAERVDRSEERRRYTARRRCPATTPKPPCMPGICRK